MPQNSFEQLKMSKNLGGRCEPPQTPSWVGKNFQTFFSVDMSGIPVNVVYYIYLDSYVHIYTPKHGVVMLSFTFFL